MAQANYNQKIGTTEEEFCYSNNFNYSTSNRAFLFKFSVSLVSDQLRTILFSLNATCIKSDIDELVSEKQAQSIFIKNLHTFLININIFLIIVLL